MSDFLLEDDGGDLILEASGDNLLLEETTGTAQPQSGLIQRFCRRPIAYVELDLDTAPAVPGTYRFNSQEVLAPVGVISSPLIVSISAQEERANPADGLGQAGKVTVKLKDFVLPAYPYPVTFWRDLVESDKYYKNRDARILRGQNLDDPSSLSAEHYRIHNITGPDKNDVVTVELTSWVRLADYGKARDPEASTGVIATDINASDPTVVFDLAPSGIGSDYPSSGVGSMGEEIGTYARSGDTITFTNRGSVTVGLRTFVSEVVAHEAGDTFQNCTVYERERYTEIIYDQLIKAKFPASVLPLADWNALAEDYASVAIYDAIIPESTAVKATVQDLCKENQTYLWWAADKNEMRLEIIRPRIGETPNVITDEIILEGSFSRRRMDDRRVSTVVMWWAMRDPTADEDEPKSYARRRGLIDSASVSNYGESQVMTVKSRFIVDDFAFAQLAGRVTSRYAETPWEYRFDLDYSDGFKTPASQERYEIGDVLELRTDRISSKTQQAIPRVVQIVAISLSANSQRWTVVTEDFRFEGRYGLITPNTQNDYPDATVEELSRYAFIGPNSGDFSDGNQPYRIL